MSSVIPFTNRSRNDLIAMGYNSRADMIAAGLDYRILPVPTTAHFEEVYDAGTVIESTQIDVTPNFQAVVGSVDYTVTLSTRAAPEDPWLDHPVGQTAVFASAFQFVKVAIDFVSDGNSFVRGIDIRTVLASKLKNDAGTVMVNANPTPVQFSVEFIDVTSIELTPRGTTPRHAVFDFLDEPYPTSFDIYLFDNVGNPVTGEVSWSARGY